MNASQVRLLLQAASTGGGGGRVIPKFVTITRTRMQTQGSLQPISTITTPLIFHSRSSSSSSSAEWYTSGQFNFSGSHSVPQERRRTQSLMASYNRAFLSPPMPDATQVKSISSGNNHVLPRSSSALSSCLLRPKSFDSLPSRGKSKKSGKKGYQKQKEETDSDEDKEEEEEESLEVGTDFRDLEVRVSSLRMDALLKAGLNMSRHKVETAFYASKIRINGEKFLKKSHHCHQGDEIDIIKAVSRQNPNNLHVSRLVVLSLLDDSGSDSDSDNANEKVTVRLRRYPNLLIERYQDYTPGESEEE